MIPITLKFSDHPPGPNEHMNHRERAQVFKKWKVRTVHRIMIDFGGIVPKFKQVKISAVFYRSRLGVADEDNDRARLKPIVDGIRDSGMIPNDTRKYVVWGEVNEEKGERGFKVIIEEAFNCTRCNKLKDTEPFILGTYFCLSCYAKMVVGYLNSHCESLEEYLQSWLDQRAEAPGS